MPSVPRLKGHLEIAYLEQSIGEIINRHEVLRTVIGEYQGEAYQQIKPLNGWHLEKLDGSDYQTNSQALAQKIYASCEFNRISSRRSYPGGYDSPYCLGWLVNIGDGNRVGRAL